MSSNDMDEVLQVLSTSTVEILLVGLCAAVVSYCIFHLLEHLWLNRRLNQWLKEPWLDERITRYVDQFKEEQQQELERLRGEIQTGIGRIGEVHEKEIEILPQAWQLLYQAQKKAVAAISVSRQAPDFGRMSQPQFEEFLANCQLPVHERDSLRHAENRVEHYRQAMSQMDRSQAQLAQAALQQYMATNRIFLSEEVARRFQSADAALHDLFAEPAPGDTGYLTPTSEKVAHLSRKVAAVEIAVQKRLRFEDVPIGV